jgi:hypothetical protein
MYLYKGNLRNFIYSLYVPFISKVSSKKEKEVKILLSIRKVFRFKKNFNDYMELYKFKHLSLSIQDLRNLLFRRIDDDMLTHLGFSKEATNSYISWVFSSGLLSQKERIVERLYTLNNVLPLDIEARYNTSMQAFKYSPLIFGLKSQIFSSLKVLYSYLSGKTSLDLLVKEMVFPGMDVLAGFRRNEIEEVIYLDRLWKTSYRKVNFFSMSESSFDD